MQNWYRSGIEGYCKAAARMMGLPDNNSGWGNFGRELFADGRFDDPAQASKAWTLSRSRAQGRSNRLNIFEDSWLGKHGRDCELDAIHACVHGMCNNSNDSVLYELYRSSPDTFAASFHDTVLPAIADGFAAERYHPSDIARFAQGIDRVLERLDPALPQTFRNFAIPLVAGVVYGPAHPVAQSHTNSATYRPVDASTEDDLPFGTVNDDTIVLTQLFSADAGLVGHSIHYDSDCAILLGRDSDFAKLLDGCDAVTAEALRHKRPIAFPISHTHKTTSKTHGMIARIDERWYYLDASSNGSYIENASQPSSVHCGIVALAPGDRIYLGLAEPPTNDSAAFLQAATILVSFTVDERA